VKLYLFGIVVNANIHLLTGSETAFPRFNSENSLLQDVSLKGLLLSWLTWIGPRFKLNLVVIWHFELPFRRNATNIFEGQGDLPGLGSILDGYLAKVPGKAPQVLLQIMNALVSLL